MECSGVGGKLIHEKNQKQKISWHYPFNKKVLVTTYFYENGATGFIHLEDCAV